MRAVAPLLTLLAVVGAVALLLMLPDVAWLLHRYVASMVGMFSASTLHGCGTLDKAFQEVRHEGYEGSVGGAGSVGEAAEEGWDGEVAVAPG